MRSKHRTLQGKKPFLVLLLLQTNRVIGLVSVCLIWSYEPGSALSVSMTAVSLRIVEVWQNQRCSMFLLLMTPRRKDHRDDDDVG
jgi:hypothetical protein